MKNTIEKPADRLIVAVDIKPTGRERRESVWTQGIKLLDRIKGTRVFVKLNSGLRALGYDYGDEVHDRGLRLFADLKLIDISRTLAIDGDLLQELRPEILTCMCSAGRRAMQKLRSALPDTEILGVTVLTDIDDEEASKMFAGKDVLENVLLFARKAKEAGLDGIVCAPSEAMAVREVIGQGMTIVTPAVRPVWSVVEDDDQNQDRVMTPTKAFAAGADRIVVGGPIVGSKNQYDATVRTLDEIASFTF